MTNRKQEGIPVRVSQRRLLETMDGIHKEIVEVATEHHVVTFCRKRLDELIKDYGKLFKTPSLRDGVSRFV